MYRVYAHDPQMRINMGIRRRLAPLMGNNRRRIELLNGLLFSLPGTPVLYYGDEIGMGDNVYLGDRNGVRTPMQWSSDRNAGFSQANRQRLFLPVITDPEYHYEAVNVDAQQANPNSLLWWMKRLITLRRQHQAFGRGSLTFLHPENRKVVAFLRELGDERILVVANTSRFVQYAELNLPDHEGLVPVEMFGRVEFPRLSDRPFFITLGPHSFMWFTLEADPSGRGSEVRVSGEPLPVIDAPNGLASLLTGKSSAPLLNLLPGYMRARRWFRSKSRRIKSVSLHDSLPLGIGAGEATMAIFNVDFTDGESERYLLPLALAPAHGEEQERITRDMPQAVIATVRDPGSDDGQPELLLYDALYDTSVTRGLLDAIGNRRRINGRGGQLAASPTKAFRRLRGSGELTAVPARAEQSNTSIAFGERLVLKLFRRLDEGINPDVEISQALTDAGFGQVPALAGWLAYRSRGEPAAVGVLQEYVTNQGDAWQYTLDQLGAFYERAAASEADAPASAVDVPALLEAASDEPSDEVRELTAPYLDAAWLLGVRTAELHRALAGTDEPAFAPEPFNPFYQRSLFQNMRNQASDALALLEKRIGSIDPELRASARRAAGMRDEVMSRLRRLLGQPIDASRIRIHGDFHAGQVLGTGRDFVIIDFEGEPGRPLSERRHKRTALIDVAGMLRSFHYAAYGTLLSERVGDAIRPEDVTRLEPWARFWYRWAAATYLRGYLTEARHEVFVPRSDAALAGLLEAAMINKVLYELNYELNNRPDWLAVPLRGLFELLGQADEEPIDAA